MKSLLKKIWFACGFVSLVWATITSPAIAETESPLCQHARQAKTVVDIALSAQGTLSGRLTSPDGTPLRNQLISLSSGTTVLQTTKTDSAGSFIFHKVTAGSLAITSENCYQHVRAWPRASAPPIAKHAVNLVSGPTVRGQFGSTIGGFTAPSIHPSQYLQHPATVFGVMGLAIAVPLAIHEETTVLPATQVFFYSPSLSQPNILPNSVPIGP